jgi:hypothetical protein
MPSFSVVTLHPDSPAARRRAEAIGFGLLIAAAFSAIQSTLLTLVAGPQFLGLDVIAYLRGAARLVESGSPYSAALLAGPIEHSVANVPIAYLYPPPLAQAFVPLLSLPYPVVASVWMVGQAATLLVMLPMVYRATGGRVSPKSLACLTLVALAFVPFHWATFIGNVSGWVAVAVAAALLRGGWSSAVATGTAAWVKLTPGPLALGTLLASRSRWRTAAVLLVIPAVSFAISPGAWSSFADALPSLIQMPAARGAFNISPANVLLDTPFAPGATVLQIGLAAAFMAALLTLALSDRTIGWVASAVGLYLTATSTTWIHYAVVLLPIGVAAWPRATLPLRLILIGGLACFGPLWGRVPHWWFSIVSTCLWAVALLGIAWAERPPRISHASTDGRTR